MIARALAVMGLIIAADQWSKVLVLRVFPATGDGAVLLPGIFDLRHVQNAGAAWGMLQGRQALLIACAVAALVWMTLQMRRTFLPLRFGWVTWGLLTGGIIGNVIDRVWRGVVIDFIDFHCIRFPTFNVADMAISVGVASLILSQWLHERKHKHSVLEG
ncbi:MAG: signal peptidase II [Lentisphaerae bacterium]|nr:signal peptidase II [Lentisphaerota bacterium]